MARQTYSTQDFYRPSDEAIQGYYDGMRKFWHPVLPVADLKDGELRAIELLEENIVLARLSGKLVAMQDLCRHFQAKLSIGEIRTIEDAGECISCKYHGWAYDSTGMCVELPQLVEGRGIPASARIPVYPVEERHDLIWVCLEENPHFDIPEFPELSDPAYTPGPLQAYEPWDAAAPRCIMGTLDDTHFPWVHEGLLGDREHAEVPDHKVWREERTLRVEFNAFQPKNILIDEEEIDGQVISGQNSHQNYHVGIPNVLRLVTVHSPVNGDLEVIGKAHTHVIWLATFPQRYNRTQTFWRLARNFDTDPANNDAYEEFEARVRAQDKPLVESQRPWLLPPFWTKIEMPLRPADLPLIEYQKWLEELGIAVGV
jgi:phenylpropionate dioxygenase-like ring-hydroxylating dioxygenase large terminal subunit